MEELHRNAEMAENDKDSRPCRSNVWFGHGGIEAHGGGSPGVALARSGEKTGADGVMREAFQNPWWVELLPFTGPPNTQKSRELS